MDQNNSQIEKKILTPNSTTNTSSNGGNFIPINDVSLLHKTKSNFVFFFGKALTGKSVILASMLYHMNTEGSIRPKKNTPEAEVLLFDFIDGLKRGQLPSRSQKDKVIKIDLVFEPNNKSKKIKPVDLAFLEVAGDNHIEIKRGGAYHQSIEEYLNADIPLHFILVTDYDNACDDDALIISFLNELVKKGRNIKYINAIIVIAKWDKSGSIGVAKDSQLNDFIRLKMPMTHSQIENYSFSKTFYTVGDFGINEKGEERLNQLDLSTAKVLTDWLYESITGIDLNYEGTFWERLVGK
ncbi:MAG: hypothetical protein ACOYOE_00010 [Chlorobium sp.]